MNSIGVKELKAYDEHIDSLVAALGNLTNVDQRKKENNLSYDNKEYLSIYKEIRKLIPELEETQKKAICILAKDNSSENPSSFLRNNSSTLSKIFAVFSIVIVLTGYFAYLVKKDDRSNNIYPTIAYAISMTAECCASYLFFKTISSWKKKNSLEEIAKQKNLVEIAKEKLLWFDKKSSEIEEVFPENPVEEVTAPIQTMADLQPTCVFDIFQQETTSIKGYTARELSERFDSLLTKLQGTDVMKGERIKRLINDLEECLKEVQKRLKFPKTTFYGVNETSWIKCASIFSLIFSGTGIIVGNAQPEKKLYLFFTPPLQIAFSVVAKLFSLKVEASINDRRLLKALFDKKERIDAGKQIYKYLQENKNCSARELHQFIKRGLGEENLSLTRTEEFSIPIPSRNIS